MLSSTATALRHSAFTQFGWEMNNGNLIKGKSTNDSLLRRLHTIAALWRTVATTLRNELKECTEPRQSFENYTVRGRFCFT